MNVVIVRYNAGNTLSVANALRRIGVEPLLSDDPETLRRADKVIFPGVGAAGSAMEYLRARGLGECLAALRQPVLGICLGLQLLCRRSEEDNVECLGVFPAEVRRFTTSLKVPHVGWSTVAAAQGRLFAGFPETHQYYVHSYRADLCEQTAAVTEYGGSFSAALERDNFFAVQFHPEKSGPAGEALLERFVRL